MAELKTNSTETDLSIIMPCLNEETTIGECIKKAQGAIGRLRIKAEIIVVDNGSKDKSAQIAVGLGAKVICEPNRGYGNVCRRGFQEAKGKYVIMADADDTYDFSQIEAFLIPLKNGFDFVMGSRFKGKIHDRAMPWVNRYIGNPILTAFLRFLFGVRISDTQCGFRAIAKDAYQKLGLITTGMEFASEMIVAAIRYNLKIAEVPIDYYPRLGDSKLVPMRDAWRHLRFMLLFSPTHVFLIPGLFLFSVGMISLVLTPYNIFVIAGHKFDVHFMILSSFVAILGFQILNLGFYARTYSLTQGFVREDKTMAIFWKFFNLEKGLILGFVLFLVGFAFTLGILLKWVALGFGALFEIPKAIIALTLMVIGMQIFFSSFFLSILGIQKK